MNVVILLLLLTDVLVLTGFGLIDPILAIFINSNLEGGTIAAAGIASTLFLLTKSFVQLPFSRHIDARNDHWDLRALIIGTCIVTCVPLAYVFVRSVTELYIAQVILGIGSGLAYPAWLGLWSTHLDKKQESFEWSLYSTVTGFGTAIAATIGGLIAEYFGFRWTFGFVSLLALSGCLTLLVLRRLHAPTRRKKRKT